jgi:D-alanyl-D-alanine carboxypeptidase
VLGVVIEKVTGQSYYDYVQQHIYAPAGMTHTGSPPEGQAIPGRAIGYTKAPGPTASAPSRSWVPNTKWLHYRGTSADSSYSTVEDLARFARALLSHKLLDRDNTELLITGKVRETPGPCMPAAADPRGKVRYAYGFEDARNASGDGWVGHGGSWPGMTGDFRIYPKSGNLVVGLTNMFRHSGSRSASTPGCPHSDSRAGAPRRSPASTLTPGPYFRVVGRSACGACWPTGYARRQGRQSLSLRTRL